MGGVYLGHLVELFFIISGVLTFKYIDIIKKDLLKFNKFYVKKYLRFYPHSTISIVAYLILNYFYKLKFGTYDFIKSINPLDFLISTSGICRWGIVKDPGYNNPLYYVSILMFCYIVFYFCVYLAKRLQIDENHLFLFVILIGLYILNQKIDFLFLNNSLYRGYVAFFIGIFLAGVRITKANKLYIIIPSLLVIYLFNFPNISIQYYLSTFVIFPLAVLHFLNTNFPFRTFNKIIMFFDKYVFYICLACSIIVAIQIFRIACKWTFDDNIYCLLLGNWDGILSFDRN